VIAEFDEVATGERTPGLLQAATRCETSEIDRPSLGHCDAEPSAPTPGKADPPSGVTPGSGRVGTVPTTRGHQ